MPTNLNNTTILIISGLSILSWHDSMSEAFSTVLTGQSIITWGNFKKLQREAM